MVWRTRVFFVLARWSFCDRSLFARVYFRLLGLSEERKGSEESLSRSRKSDTPTESVMVNMTLEEIETWWMLR